MATARPAGCSSPRTATPRPRRRQLAGPFGFSITGPDGAPRHRVRRAARPRAPPDRRVPRPPAVRPRPPHPRGRRHLVDRPPALPRALPGLRRLRPAGGPAARRSASTSTAAGPVAAGDAARPSHDDEVDGFEVDPRRRCRSEGTAPRHRPPAGRPGRHHSSRTSAPTATWSPSAPATSPTSTSTRLDDVAAGPVAFAVELPRPARYRLFLDFQHDGVVHTAAFTVDAGPRRRRRPRGGADDAPIRRPPTTTDDRPRHRRDDLRLVRRPDREAAQQLDGVTATGQLRHRAGHGHCRRPTSTTPTLDRRRSRRPATPPRLPAPPARRHGRARPVPSADEAAELARQRLLVSRRARPCRCSLCRWSPPCSSTAGSGWRSPWPRRWSRGGRGRSTGRRGPTCATAPPPWTRSISVGTLAAFGWSL